MNLQLLQKRLGHQFGNSALLQQALTHRSHSVLHNERLEFLGDSVLNSGGFRRPSILTDTLEALFGGVFLDAGFDAAKEVIRALYAPILESVDPTTLGKDAKTLLQEFLQSRKIALPQYNVVATHGAAHNQEFEIECLVPKLDIQVFGTGGSRRAGEQAAAKLALESAIEVLSRTPASRKSKPRAAQLKLAGIATPQNEVVVDANATSEKSKNAPDTDAKKASENPANPNHHPKIA